MLLVALDSNSSKNRFGNEEANVGTHACTMDLLKILTLEEEVVSFEVGNEGANKGNPCLHHVVERHRCPTEK